MVVEIKGMIVNVEVEWVFDEKYLKILDQAYDIAMLNNKSVDEVLKWMDENLVSAGYSRYYPTGEKYEFEGY